MLDMRTYKTLYEYMRELNSVVTHNYQNTNFRYKSLKLMKKYFGVDTASFLVFDDHIHLDANIRIPHLDNVTIGMPDAALQEYYKKYYLYDPLRSTPSGNTVVRLSDIISTKEFEKTDFYNNFYKKYNLRYQIGTGIQMEDRVIGSLSFVRSEAQGDYSDTEMELLAHIRDSLTPELVQCLYYESLLLENFALRDYSSVFPIAQIMLDYRYNVVYYNSQAEIYCAELTGAPPEQFKYYFVNHLRSQHLLDRKDNNCIFESGHFTIKVSMHTREHNIANPQQQYYVIVYITKNREREEGLPEENKYFQNLTEREKDIVLLMKQGFSNMQIAKELFISPYTVKSHMQRLYKKNDVNSKTKLLYLLFENRE